jgi:hypothetical protein
MWFHDDELGGRKWAGWKKKSRSRQILQVNATRSAQKRARMRQTSVYVVVPVAVAVLALLIWLGAVQTGRALYSQNDRFKLTNLEIKCGDVINRDLIKEYTGIKEGMNLFGMNIQTVRDHFLRITPNVKSMEIERVLPDTLKITVTERIPLARMGSTGGYVVDDEGYIFFRAAMRGLPMIMGLKGEPLPLGMKVDGMAMAAIEVVEMSEDPRFNMNIENISIDSEEYLSLHAICGETAKDIKLAWKGMGKKTPDSKRRLFEKMSSLVKVNQSDKGRKLSKLNATYDDPGKVTGE